MSSAFALTVRKMDYVTDCAIQHWVASVRFPQLGDYPPEYQEQRQGLGPSRATRTHITRALYELNVGGTPQLVDTVRHAWRVPRLITCLFPNPPSEVKVYLPLERYGTVSRDLYRRALTQATKALFNGWLGPLHRQPFMLDYVVRRLDQMRTFIQQLPLQCFSPDFLAHCDPIVEYIDAPEISAPQPSGPQDRFSIQSTILRNPPRLRLMASLPGERLPCSEVNRPNRFHFHITIPLQGALTPPTAYGQSQPVAIARREYASRQVQRTMISSGDDTFI